MILGSGDRYGEMEDPQPQHVVGDPPPIAGLLQVVVRLQHCNYTFVNDPREILF